MRELREKEQEVLDARSLFSPELFQIRNNMLVFQRNTDKNQTEPAGQICVPADMFRVTWCICHEGHSAGHHGIAETLAKFQQSFFVISALDKIRLVGEKCDQCIAKEHSVKQRVEYMFPAW